MGRKTKKKSSAATPSDNAVGSKEVQATKSSQSPSSKRKSPAKSNSNEPATATTTTAVVPKKSAKLAAKRAKVLSYEAALAPQPNAVKGEQSGAAPTRSVGEAERVARLAAQLRKMEDEKEKEKQRKREEKAKRMPLTSTEKLRGKAKTAFDVWDNHPSKAAVSVLLEERQVAAEWVDPALPKPVKAPKGLLARQHPTNLPAVEVAAPGNSYRPTYEDHQDVLGEVLAKRLKRREEKRKLNKTVRPITQGLKRKHNNIHEYTEGLEDILGIKKKKGGKEEGAEAEASVEEEPIRKRPIGSSRWSLKLSKAERNKQKAKENRRKTKKYKRLLKKRKTELEAIPEIAREVEEEEEEQEGYLERKRAEKANAEGRTKQLSRYGFARQPAQYLLSDEIPQTLRALAPLQDYNPLKERFISLQKRNLIEARVRVKPTRRFRVKYYEPQSAKMDWELPK